jgi:hypothetical protein
MYACGMHAYGVVRGVLEYTLLTHVYATYTVCVRTYDCTVLGNTLIIILSDTYTLNRFGCLTEVSSDLDATSDVASKM